MKKNLILRYAITFALIVGIILLLVYLNGREKTNYQAPPPAVKTIKPVSRDITKSIKLTGYIEADAMVPVVPKVSGTILQYPAKAGAKVAEGETLAVIDDAPFRQEMLQAKAAYLGLQSTFERVEGLFKTGAATRQTYDSTKAQRDASKAQFELAELQLSYTNVTSPISGTILNAPLSKGNIAYQQPVAVVADLSKLVVRLNVPEKYFDLFNSNTEKISAIISRNDETITCTATIDTVAPYVQSETKTFQTVLVLDESASEKFKPGMFAKVNVIYETAKDVPALPLTARTVDGSTYIYQSETKSVKLETLPLEIFDSEYFEIPKEFSESDFLIEGQNLVFDGQTVNLISGDN